MTAVWLVLCGLDDMSAIWACKGLEARGLAPIELVTADMLAYSLRWKHQLGQHGVTTEITLADGRTIATRKVRGVLNRLTFFPADHLRAAQPVDRDYAQQELMAFALSWLYALPRPMLNEPTAQGLSGQWRHRSEWTWLAGKAGLPTSRYQQSSRNFDCLTDSLVGPRPGTASTHSAIVVGNRVFGRAVSPQIAQGCRQLARLADTAMLGVEFAQDTLGPPTFVNATPLPDLRAGGAALLDTLTTQLRQAG